LEARLGISASHWFEGEVMKDTDYPSGEYVRTNEKPIDMNSVMM
jgi:hypothetical protein